MAISATGTQFRWGKTGERWELTVNKSAEQLARETAGDPVATFVGATVTLKFGSSKANAALVTFAAGQGLTVLDAEQDTMKVQIATYTGWDNLLPEPAGSRVLGGEIALQLANGQLQIEDVELTVLSSY
jgi:hypothetical protein